MILFIKECRQILKSIIYFAFVGVIILAYVTQLGDYVGADIKLAGSGAQYTAENPIMVPPVDAENYGEVQEEIPEQIMTKSMAVLLQEYTANQYVTYPVGVYKTVVLDEKQQQRVGEIIEEMTGTKAEALTNNPVNISVSYDVFKQRMVEIDGILGHGSGYNASALLKYGQRPLTYEEKMKEYNAFLMEDRVTGAYARLFCDYMGIFIALFGVFVPVAFLVRDRKSQMSELIYSRQSSSLKIVLIRYFAVVFMSILPVLILSIRPTVQLVSYGVQENIAVDVFGFVKYIIAWLIPTLMVTNAVGFLLTTLTGTPIAIAVQFLWSFLVLNESITKIYGGDYAFELLIRHNTLGNLQGMKDDFGILVMNRVGYTVFALILIVITVLIYEQKRRGRINARGSLQNILEHNKGAV